KFLPEVLFHVLNGSTLLCGPDAILEKRMRRFGTGEAYQSHVLEQLLACHSEVDRVLRFARNGEDLSRPPFRTRTMPHSIAHSKRHPLDDSRVLLCDLFKRHTAAI